MNKYTIRRVCAVVIFVILLISVFAIVMSITKTPKIVDYEMYEVTCGDTLWNIAKMSNGYGRVDIRDIIVEIEYHSNCTSDINAHDIVYIPIYDIK